MSQQLTNSTSGFTLVELMIATAVFSTILLICTAAIIQISRIYFKGIIGARTQDVTQTISDDISRAIQFSGSDVVPISPTTSPPPLSVVSSGFCIDNTRFSYTLDHELSSVNGKNQSTDVLVVDDYSNCTGGGAVAQDVTQPISSLASGSHELLGDHMRLADLTINCYQPGALPLTSPPPCKTTNLYQLSITVVYGDQEVLNGSFPSYSCVGNSNGGQFCSVSTLTTIIQKRV